MNNKLAMGLANSIKIFMQFAWESSAYNTRFGGTTTFDQWYEENCKDLEELKENLK